MSGSENMNYVYDAVLITVGAIGVSMTSKKILGEPLGTPEKMKGYVRLAVAVSASTLLIKYLQKNEYIPVDPFKKKTS